MWILITIIWVLLGAGLTRFVAYRYQDGEIVGPEPVFITLFSPIALLFVIGWELSRWIHENVKVER